MLAGGFTQARERRLVHVEPVDLALVLMIDASGSIAEDRLRLQIEGHARAIEDQTVLRAIGTGTLGRIAITFAGWTSADRQAQLVGWTVIDGAETARSFAAAMRRASVPLPGYTSISGAIDFAVLLLRENGFDPTHRVVDICGNGTNNDGRPVAEARDEAVAEGVTINGLAILDAAPDLDAYFAAHVIGGSRAFVSVARSMDVFATSVLRKLLQEIT